MSPKREENVKTLTGLSSQKDEFEFPDCSEAAILEISSLLGTDAETLLLYLVFSQNDDLNEGVFSSRLKTRFHAINADHSLLHCKEYILRHLGLDVLAREAWNYITSKCLLEDNHLDIIDWAVLYVQKLIQYSLFPENVCGKFPYQESTVNSWFIQAKDEGDANSGEVNVLNRMEKKQNQDEPYPLLDEKDFPQGIEEDGYKLLYHGTDHNSAVSILEDGIDLTKGKAHMDFSHGSGFYLNNNFQAARKWAFRRYKTKQAVVIFKISNEVLDSFREKSMNLFEKEDEWRRIIHHFRFHPDGKEKKREGRKEPTKAEIKEMKKEMKKKMKQISFIEGPMASVSPGISCAVKINGPLEGSYQMCIHSDKLAEQLDSCLHCIVFFRCV